MNKYNKDDIRYHIAEGLKEKEDLAKRLTKGNAPKDLKRYKYISIINPITISFAPIDPKSRRKLAVKLPYENYRENLKIALFNKEQLASLLSVSERTLDEIRRSGNIDYYRITEKNFLFSQYHLEQFLEKAEVKACPEKHTKSSCDPTVPIDKSNGTTLSNEVQECVLDQLERQIIKKPRSLKPNSSLNVVKLMPKSKHQS